ncbi:hypothetical protein T07_13756 [Trichinella nelsoni]|uniref:Uncharacterized protein n=1 Tax=Trichinella nelsoni TaxID=6336 RepID=A0A0V0RFM3_9BILA|nr:hypothetical protein T07_13756 [Trichinella nelsoni]
MKPSERENLPFTIFTPSNSESFLSFFHITAIYPLNHRLHILAQKRFLAHLTVFSEIAQILVSFSLKLRAVAKVHHKRWSDAAFCYLSRGNVTSEDQYSIATNLID